MAKLNYLPEEVILNILTRLPTESVLESKLVCKAWRDLVSNHPSFSQMHLTHLSYHNSAAPKLTFIGVNKHYKLHHLEYNEKDDDEDTLTIARIKNPLFDGCGIIGSCNGLICLSASQRADNKPAYYIYNPITKEYIILPKSKRVMNEDNNACSGFGYVRETNQYKVVRINRKALRFGFGQVDRKPGTPSFCSVEVYTLGSGNGWRDLGEFGLNSDVYYFGTSFGTSSGVFASETIYWITCGNLVGFNLADEKFVEYSRLPCLFPWIGNSGELGLRVLGESLLCYYNEYQVRSDMWLLKKNGNMMEEEEYLSLKWSEKVGYMEPLALKKSGGLLCYYRYKHLYSFDKCSCLKTRFDFPLPFFQTIPHMSTFVSLKALGEVDIKTME